MKVYLETLGCRLNEAEIEAMARGFAGADHEIVQQPELADLCVINTCAVTADAARTSRNRIRAFNRASPNAQIIATGCYTQLAPDAVRAMPGVAAVVDNLQKDRLVPIALHEPTEPMDAEPLAVDLQYRPGTHGHTRAFVKVQDGCDNLCTFCITRVARGPGRSRAVGEIVAEINAMGAAGYREAVLTGVQIGSYGERAGGLTDLLRTLLAATDMPRLRISSLEPWDLDAAFFRLWENPRLLPHLHLPLQSGCDAILRRMLRRTDQAGYRALVNMARGMIPDLALSTDVIVGFPGETAAEFAISRAFIEEMGFMRLHVFPYSPRPGTAAARMRGQVEPPLAKARGEILRSVSAQGERAHLARLANCPETVLWESVIGATEQGWINSGLTRTYARAYWTGPRVLTNEVTHVRLGTVERDGLAVAEFV